MVVVEVNIEYMWYETEIEKKKLDEFWFPSTKICLMGQRTFLLTINSWTKILDGNLKMEWMKLKIVSTNFREVKYEDEYILEFRCSKFL